MPHDRESVPRRGSRRRGSRSAAKLRRLAPCVFCRVQCATRRKAIAGARQQVGEGLLAARHAAQTRGLPHGKCRVRRGLCPPVVTPTQQNRFRLDQTRQRQARPARRLDTYHHRTHRPQVRRALAHQRHQPRGTDHDQRHIDFAAQRIALLVEAAERNAPGCLPGRAFSQRIGYHRHYPYGARGGIFRQGQQARGELAQFLGGTRRHVCEMPPLRTQEGVELVGTQRRAVRARHAQHQQRKSVAKRELVQQHPPFGGGLGAIAAFDRV